MRFPVARGFPCCRDRSFPPFSLWSLVKCHQPVFLWICYLFHCELVYSFRLPRRHIGFGRKLHLRTKECRIVVCYSDVTCTAESFFVLIRNIVQYVAGMRATVRIPMPVRTNRVPSPPSIA